MSNEIVERPARASDLAMTGRGQGAALVPQSLGDVVTFSALMARAGHAVPKHLRDNQGACFAVCMRAFSLEMEPFAFASKTYFVNDNMAFEAQLVAAIVISRAPIIGRPVYEFTGEGPTRKCTVTVEIAGGVKLPYTSPQNQQIKVKNSPLWISDLDQQLGYYSIRALGRRHFPEVLMGIYTPEERMAGVDDDDKVMSFDTMEQRAIAARPAEVTVVEDKKPDPKPAKAAASPAAKDPAGPASPAGTATERGSEPTGGDTGLTTTEGLAGDKRPQDPAAAQNAGASSGTKDSATDASTGSPAGNSSQQQLSLDIDAGSDDSFPGDREPAGAAEQQPDTQETEDASEPVDDALLAFADALAEAKAWSDITTALGVLTQAPWWTNADYDAKEKCRGAMYHRLLALREHGEKTDPALDMHAYRAYIAFETDVEALKHMRSAAAKVGCKAWDALATPSKIALDKAFDDRVRALASAPKVEEFS